MTNREKMIALLTDWSFIDDDGASEEAMINHHIKCPYNANDDRGLCDDRVSSVPSEDLCYECKTLWLNSEVDV